VVNQKLTSVIQQLQPRGINLHHTIAHIVFTLIGNILTALNEQ